MRFSEKKFSESSHEKNLSRLSEKKKKTTTTTFDLRSGGLVLKRGLTPMEKKESFDVATNIYSLTSKNVSRVYSVILGLYILRDV